MAHTVFGNDAQIVRLGCFLVEYQLRTLKTHGAIASSPELKRAIRAAWPTLKDLVGALEVFRRCPDTSEDFDRAMYEAIYGRSLFRKMGRGNSGKPRRLYGSHISISGRSDRERVKAAEKDRRRRLEKKIAAECAALLVLHGNERRTIFYRMLLEIDFAEVQLRQTFGRCRHSQAIVTKLVGDLRAFLLYEHLKTPTTQDRPSSEILDNIIRAAFERIEKPEAPGQTIRFYMPEDELDGAKIEITDLDAVVEYLVDHSASFRTTLKNISLRFLLSGKKMRHARLVEKNLF